MADWRLLTNEEALAIWDRTLMGFDDCSPYQSYAWGEYRKALGWEPCRWIAFDHEGKAVAMIQGGLRRYAFGVGLIWCEGGPVGELTVCDDSLQTAIKAGTGLKRIYFRFRCDRRRHIDDVLRLSAQGWRTTWSPLTSNYSLDLDLTQDEDRVLAACDRNFRRNLRNSSASKVTVTQWSHASADEVLSVYASMQNLKGIEEQLSRAEISQMLRELNQGLVLYRCNDEAGEVVSLLGVLIAGAKATSLLWATSEKGRQLLASYPIFWAIIQHCRRSGVRVFDLAGVDPIRNPGVYRFKRAAGGQPIEYLGEWDWATSQSVQWFGNWSIANRDHLKRIELTLKRNWAPRRSMSVRTTESGATADFAAGAVT
jgi:hypothetical protein